MVTVVNQVGVDVNAAACMPWRAPPLQFVAGLGPRKAAALLQAVQRDGGAVPTRLDLRRLLRNNNKCAGAF
jgi:transcription elongation factor SPT6